MSDDALRTADLAATDPNVTTDSVTDGRSGGNVFAPPSGSRYELVEEIARGGMGAVWRATDRWFHREVAVKVLLGRYALDSGTAARFAAEAEIAGQLQHPGIPPIHDVGTLEDGRPYLAMKLIKGRTLEALLGERPNPAHDRGRFVAVFEQICQAIAYAHANGVIHRDLKPGNVMVGAFGEVQVMDWGLAKILARAEPEYRDDAAMAAPTTGTDVISLHDTGASYTQAGSVLGTPAFMPPEQAAGLITLVDARSDVFGLGAVLAVVLTGVPPFMAGGAEATRALAALGQVAECCARLDTCGAEPDLVALCKRCLSPRQDDRPADAGEVARAVADLRVAADERARAAELDRVRLQGERQAETTRAAERQKRRRLAISAAAGLAIAIVGGLAAVLLVQREANTALEAKNDELETKNDELATERARVEQRFALARKAIATFHTGVSQDALLKNDQLRGLRTSLLKQAAVFYADLEKLLATQADASSRRLLADGYFDLGDLTEKIGSKPQALEVHRQALAVRRELAVADDAGAEARLDVARSLAAVGKLLRAMRDPKGALEVFLEQQAIAAEVLAVHPSDDARAVLAQGLHESGVVLSNAKKPDEALAAYRQALALRQVLASARASDPDSQSDLGRTHNNMGVVAHQMHKPAEALAAWRQAIAVFQKLVDAHPNVVEHLNPLATLHNNIGAVLCDMGDLDQGLAQYRRAMELRKRVADLHPAVTFYQTDLAQIHNNIGNRLEQLGKRAEALEAYRQELPVRQKIADLQPAMFDYQLDLATCHASVGWQLARLGQYAEAIAALNKGMPIVQKLSDEHPTEMTSLIHGYTHAYRGWSHVRAGHASLAAADLRSALKRWAKVKGLDGDPDTSFEQARVLALLAGLGTDTKSSVTVDESAQAAAQAVVALRTAVKAGWKKPEDLREPDFDALRRRDDFQQVVKGLASKG